MKPILEFLLGSKNPKISNTDAFGDMLDLLESNANNNEKREYVACFKKWSKFYDKDFINALCEKINEFVNTDTDIIIGYDQVRARNEKTFLIMADPDSEFKMTTFGFYNHNTLEALKITIEPEETTAYFYHKDDFNEWQGWLKNEWWPKEIFINNGYHSESIDDFKKTLDKVK